MAFVLDVVLLIFPGTFLGPADLSRIAARCPRIPPSLMALPFVLLSHSARQARWFLLISLDPHSTVPFSGPVRTPSCTVLAVLTSSIPLSFPTFPSFSSSLSFFFPHLLLSSSLPLVVTHSSAPVVASFPRLPHSRFWRPCWRWVYQQFFFFFWIKLIG